MSKKMKGVFGRLGKDETGQALVLVLMLLLLGSVTIVPLLSYISTGLLTGRMYQGKTSDLYAADAGLEDSIWQVKYGYLDTQFSTYDVYDYGSIWAYELPEQVNNRSVDVTVENIWIPMDLAAPTKEQARDIITDGKLIITGDVSADSTYQIKIFYYKDNADDPLMIETLGVWLPAGFAYVEGSSNLEADTEADYYSVPVVSPHAGGQAIVWDFSSCPFAGSGSLEVDLFPGVNPLNSPMMGSVTFQFDSSQPGRNPEAVSWITTSGVTDIPFSWDADTKVYRITSTAGDTQVEAYVASSGIRELGAAITGDYRAVGNSLMIDQYGDAGGPLRDTLLTESSTTVDDIPEDAEVAAAYLYWSAWLAGGSDEETVWEDDCSSLGNWDQGSDWTLSPPGKFGGSHSGSDDETRYLTLQDSLDLQPYQGQTVTISWDQSTGGGGGGGHGGGGGGGLGSSDGLDFAFSANGGWDWSGNIEALRGNPSGSYSYDIPVTYLTENFKVRFYLVGCDGKTIYIDNIRISVPTGTIADTTAVFEIDGQQVYFDGEGMPAQGAQEINATRWEVLENKTGTYAYSCYCDVTDLVEAFSEEGIYGNHTGNATYTVGGVEADVDDQWSYAGWSLIISYSSPETKGHQLYLYDTFAYATENGNVDFDEDGSPGGTISGFLVPEQIEGEVNAARLTVFVGEGDEYYPEDYLRFNEVALSDGRTSSDVWNSWSQGMSEDGVDIDTFNVTWASGLLEPGDTSARIDLPTGTDSWNLVYIIISFRSDSDTCGAISYVIRGS